MTVERTSQTETIAMAAAGAAAAAGDKPVSSSVVSFVQSLLTTTIHSPLNGTTEEETTLGPSTGQNVSFPADKAVLNIPLLVFLALTLVVSLAGNAGVLYVYSFRLKFSIFNQFIIALSFIDILNCVVTIPVDLANIVSGLQVDLCKVLNFTATALSCGTGLLLVLIAAVRFKVVYWPMRRPMRPLVARLLILVCMLLGAAIAWPYPVLTGGVTARSVEDRGPGAWMKFCPSDNSEGHRLNSVYHYFLFGLFCVACTALTALYAMIGKIIVKRGRQDTIPTPKPLADKSTMMLKTMKHTRNQRKDYECKLSSECAVVVGSKPLRDKGKQCKIQADASCGVNRESWTRKCLIRHQDYSLRRGSIRPMSSLQVEYDSVSDDPFSDENFFDLGEDLVTGMPSSTSSVSEVSSAGSAWEKVFQEESVDAESGIDQDTSSVFSDPFDEESCRNGGCGMNKDREALLRGKTADGTVEEQGESVSPGVFSWCPSCDVASTRLGSEDTIEETLSFRERSPSVPAISTPHDPVTGLRRNPTEPALKPRVFFHHWLPSSGTKAEDEGVQVTPILRKKVLCPFDRCSAEISPCLGEGGIQDSSSVPANKVSFLAPGAAHPEHGAQQQRCAARGAVTRKSNSCRCSSRLIPGKNSANRISISPLKCNRRRVASAFHIYRIMIFVTVSFICSYIPFLIAKGYVLWFSNGHRTYADFVFVSLAYRFSYINSVVNPFIYGCQCTNFRRELSSLCGKRIRARQR